MHGFKSGNYEGKYPVAAVVWVDTMKNYSAPHLLLEMFGAFMANISRSEQLRRRIFHHPDKDSRFTALTKCIPLIKEEMFPNVLSSCSEPLITVAW